MVHTRMLGCYVNIDFCNKYILSNSTVYPKKYAPGFCFAVLCCGYTLTDFPISIRLTSLALWQSNDCPSASKATLMNTDEYFTWIHYERLHNHNKAKHNKTVCIFLGIYCMKTPWTGNTNLPFANRIHGDQWFPSRGTVLRNFEMLLLLTCTSFRTNSRPTCIIAFSENISLFAAHR